MKEITNLERLKTGTLYAVSAGDYSDYRVIAIFSSRELAEEYMQAVSDETYNRIEEYELNPPDASFINAGYSVWEVPMLIDGTTERVHRTNSTSFDIGNVGHKIWKRSESIGLKDVLRSSVWAKTEQHAIKIVNEKRTQMIAEGLWPS